MASLTGLARARELFWNASAVRVKYAMLVRAITHGESMDRGVPGHDARRDATNG
jgi:hypothetical protein